MYTANQKRHTGNCAEPECSTDHGYWLLTYTKGIKTSLQTWALPITHSAHEKKVKSPQFLLLPTKRTEKAQRNQQGTHSITPASGTLRST